MKYKPNGLHVYSDLFKHVSLTVSRNFFGQRGTPPSVCKVLKCRRPLTTSSGCTKSKHLFSRHKTSSFLTK